MLDTPTHIYEHLGGKLSDFLIIEGALQILEIIIFASICKVQVSSN